MGSCPHERCSVGDGGRPIGHWAGRERPRRRVRNGRFCAFAGGRGAAVHGIDVDAARLEQALQRLPGADLRLGLLEDLPWPDATFDVVTGFNAFQYALDIELALAQACRVTRPGGRIAICKWDPPERNELFALLADVSDRGIDLNQLPAWPRRRRDRPRSPRRGLHGTIPVTIEIADDEALQRRCIRGRVHRGHRRAAPRRRRVAVPAG